MKTLSEDIISLIIDGVDITTNSEFVFKADSFGDKPPPKRAFIQEASTDYYLLEFVVYRVVAYGVLMLSLCGNTQLQTGTEGSRT